MQTSDGKTRKNHKRPKTLNASPPASKRNEDATHDMMVSAACSKTTKESELRVLSALTRALPREGATVMVSVKRLAERSGTSQRTAQSALQGLEANGWIRRRNTGRRSVTETTLIPIEKNAQPNGSATTAVSRTYPAYETRKRLHAVCADAMLDARAIRIAAIASKDEGGITEEDLLERSNAQTRAGRRTLKTMLERGHLVTNASRVMIARTRENAKECEKGRRIAHEMVGNCTRIENPEKDLLDQRKGRAGKISGFKIRSEKNDTRETRKKTDVVRSRRQDTTQSLPEEIRHLPIERLGLSEEEIASLKIPTQDMTTKTETQCENALIERLRSNTRGTHVKALIAAIVETLEKATTEQTEERLDIVVSKLRKAIEERSAQEHRIKAATRRLTTIEKAKRAWAELKMRSSGLVQAPLKKGQRTPTWWRPSTWRTRADSKNMETVVRTRGQIVLMNRRKKLPRDVHGYNAIYERVQEAMWRTATNLHLHRGDDLIGQGTVAMWAAEAMSEEIGRERRQ